MFGRSYPLFKLFGFQISIDASWFILVVLVTWSLATGPFSQDPPGISNAGRWIMGAAGAFGLFASIVLHELGHSIAARKCGMRMKGITLFIFGGVAEMTDEPPNATAEFIVAIAGPIVSVVLGGLFLLISAFADTMMIPPAAAKVIGYLGFINLVLVVFNMIPAFPLDGGRVLRALLWHLKKDLRWATRITATLGSGFGAALIVLGVLFAITGNLIAGVWWVVLGLFLRGAAGMSYQHVVLRKALQGEPIARFMRTDLVTVPPDLTISELVEQYVYRTQHKLYPVVDDRGTLVGCVTINAIKQLPQDQWTTTRVADLLKPCDETNAVHPQTDAMNALAMLNRTGSSRLMVVDETGRLVGVVALKDLLGFLAMKVDLEGA